MSYNVVKLLTRDDGEKVEDPVWCLVDDQHGDDPHTFCSGEFFGEGSSGCKFEQKEVSCGGVTCPACLRKMDYIYNVMSQNKRRGAKK